MADAKLPTPNGAYINRLNKVKVLDVIRREGAISRAEAARKTGLSAPTVTRIVDSLISEEKLVREAGPGSLTEIKVGRRPAMVKIRHEDNVVIGVDAGTTRIRGVLCDLNLQIISRCDIATQMNLGLDTILDEIARIGGGLLAEAVSCGKTVHGMGVAVAGLVNRETGTVEFSPDFGWENAKVSSGLQQRLDCPLLIDNVTRVMALGEMWHGIGRKHDDFVCVNVGYGIGSGIVLNGAPIYGHRGLAGEFGHLTMDKNSRVLCKCGNYGCLEALASGRAIAQSAQQELNAGASSALFGLCGGEIARITAEMVVQAAQANDPVARRILEDAAVYLGVGISGLVNLLSPTAVVIGGGMAEAGDILFDTVRATVREHVMRGRSGSVEIAKATFGLDATVVGAASLMLNEVMHLEL